MVVLALTAPAGAWARSTTHNLEAMFIAMRTGAEGGDALQRPTSSGVCSRRDPRPDDNQCCSSMDLAQPHLRAKCRGCRRHVVPPTRAGRGNHAARACLTAARSELGVDAEVIDLRAQALDEATILRSVRKTSQLVVVHGPQRPAAWARRSPRWCRRRRPSRVAGNPVRPSPARMRRRLVMGAGTGRGATNPEPSCVRPRAGY